MYIAGDRIASCYTRKKYEVIELGIMHPEEVPTSELRPGQVGYVACSMKESSEGEWHIICGKVSVDADFIPSAYWRYASPSGRTGRADAWVQAGQGYGKADRLGQLSPC